MEFRFAMAATHRRPRLIAAVLWLIIDLLLREYSQLAALVGQKSHKFVQLGGRTQDRGTEKEGKGEKGSMVPSMVKKIKIESS